MSIHITRILSRPAPFTNFSQRFFWERIYKYPWSIKCVDLGDLLKPLEYIKQYSPFTFSYNLYFDVIYQWANNIRLSGVMRYVDNSYLMFRWITLAISAKNFSRLWEMRRRERVRLLNLTRYIVLYSFSIFLDIFSTRRIQ